MIIKNYSFTNKENPKFIIDTDTNMNWLSHFDSTNYNRIFLIIDKKIDKNYRHLIFDKLKMHGKDIYDIKILAKEEEKNINTALKIINEFEKVSIGRFDLVIAIGGGFIFDVVSFVCSIYMRGISFYMIPTTLIGQVDAATAGKTCLNTSTSKNLLGTFYFADITYNNINFLKSLNPHELRQGLSEIFKYGLLGSIDLLELLDGYVIGKDYEKITKIIEETIRVRVKIRNIDPLASNLGHTFGHAFEKASNFKIGHGDAISIGTLLAIKFSEELNIAKNGLYENVKNKMMKLGLNINFSDQWNPEEISQLMLKDKKSSSLSINLVLLKDYNEPYSRSGNYFFSVSSERICRFMENYFLTFENDCDKNLFNHLKN